MKPRIVLPRHLCNVCGRIPKKRTRKRLWGLFQTTELLMHPSIYMVFTKIEYEDNPLFNTNPEWICHPFPSTKRDDNVYLAPSADYWGICFKCYQKLTKWMKFNRFEVEYDLGGHIPLCQDMAEADLIDDIGGYCKRCGAKYGGELSDVFKVSIDYHYATPPRLRSKKRSISLCSSCGEEFKAFFKKEFGESYRELVEIKKRLLALYDNYGYDGDEIIWSDDKLVIPKIGGNKKKVRKSLTGPAQFAEDLKRASESEEAENIKKT